MLYLMLKSVPVVFFNSMRLPCRHIFACRSLSKVSVFSESLCDKRWLKGYCRKTQRLFDSSTPAEPKITITETLRRRKQKPNQNERFREANGIYLKLASEFGGVLFERRLEVLKMLQDVWEKNQEISIVNLSECELC